MSGEFKMTIGRAVREIAQYYSSEESFAIKTGKHLPNRGAIIGVIKDLRRVMFPGYFGTENITDTAPEYFIGNTLTEVYVVLKQQIEIALNYQNEENKSEEEIAAEAEDICSYFFARLPHIQKLLLKDVQAGYDGDPAAKSKEEIIFSYPGLYAIFIYRIAHELYIKNVPFIPRIMPTAGQELISTPAQ